MTKFCNNSSFVSTFLLLALFACAVGMLAANAVTLKDDISDRCVLVGAPNGKVHGLKQQSHDAIVGGGFGVAAAVFAFAAGFYIYGCKSVSDDRCMLYLILLMVAGVAFAVVGSIQLARASNPEARCGAMDADGDYKLPDVEIAATFVSGLTILGLVTPLLEICISYKK